MTRIFQLLFVLTVTALIGCVAARSQGIIPAAQLEAGLKHQLPGVIGVALEDEAYRTVTDSDLWAAVDAGWMPWQAESWDCDDQAAGILHALRVRFRDTGHGPAAGRMTVALRGRGHCVVWWVDAAGRLRLLDPSTLTPLDMRLISQTRNVTDK